MRVSWKTRRDIGMAMQPRERPQAFKRCLTNLVINAGRHGTSISKLADLNGLSDVNMIRSGQTLDVPGGSGWVCPVEGARYFNDWGFPRGGSRYHEGNDLFAGRGSPVRAPVSGSLELIQGTVGGLQFNLYGSDGIEYLGSHLDAAGKTGKVSAGDVIGYDFDSGLALVKPSLPLRGPAMRLGSAKALAIGDAVNVAAA